MRGKIIRWVLPAVAGISIVGTGFSVFYFTELDGPITDSLSGNVEIAPMAPAGELVVSPQFQNGSATSPFLSVERAFRHPYPCLFRMPCSSPSIRSLCPVVEVIRVVDKNGVRGKKRLKNCHPCEWQPR